MLEHPKDNYTTTYFEKSSVTVVERQKKVIVWCMPKANHRYNGKSAGNYLKQIVMVDPQRLPYPHLTNGDSPKGENEYL